MDKSEWEKRITEKCKAARTYRPFFDVIISELAKILELRDAAQEQYDSDGGNPIQSYKNSNGILSTRKHPALSIINECNQQALAYWRDLGLTPAGYKKLNSGDSEHDNTFEDMLAKVGI